MYHVVLFGFKISKLGFVNRQLLWIFSNLNVNSNDLGLNSIQQIPSDWYVYANIFYIHSLVVNLSTHFSFFINGLLYHLSDFPNNILDLLFLVHSIQIGYAGHNSFKTCLLFHPFKKKHTNQIKITMFKQYHHSIYVC